MNPACIICNSPDCRYVFTKNNYRIHTCTTCHLSFVHPQPSDQQLKTFYSEKLFERGQKYNCRLNNGRLHYREAPNDTKKISLLRQYKKTGCVLDVGCAKGFFLYRLRHHYNIQGIELSSQAVDSARSLGIPVFEGTIEQYMTQKKWDVITLWDVIEHVKDPSSVLYKINKLTKTNGLLFLSTGDTSTFFPKLSLKYWSLMTPPIHLFFFSKFNMKKLLEKNGFQVLSITHPGKTITLDWLFFKIQDSTGIFLARWIYKILRNTMLGRVSFYINTLDIMTVVARKRNRV